MTIVKGFFSYYDLLGDEDDYLRSFLENFERKRGKYLYVDK